MYGEKNFETYMMQYINCTFCLQYVISVLIVLEWGLVFFNVSQKKHAQKQLRYEASKAEITPYTIQ